DPGVAADHVEPRRRHLLSHAGKCAQQHRTVLAIPVVADEEKPRRRPVAGDRARLVVSPEADDVYLGPVDAVVLDDRLGRPPTRSAARLGGVVAASLGLDPPLDACRSERLL